MDSRGPVKQFSRNAQATNWTVVTKKLPDNLHYFSDDKESEWLANIDPNLDKLNEKEQLHDSEISSVIEENRNSNTTKKTKTDLNVWTRWCNSINERRPMEQFGVMDNKSLIRHFLV